MTATQKTRLSLAVFIAVLACLVFLPALGNGFINWDDDKNVYDNTFIRSLDARLFTSAFLDYPVDYWRPLTWMSHAVDYAIWGLDPFGHHLTSIILHGINTLLVVLLMIRLLEAVRNTSPGAGLSDRMMFTAAGTTGLLFGLHPLHVESVAWISERKDLLCAMFFLLSIMMYTGYISEAGAGAGVGGAEGVGNDEADLKTAAFISKHYLLSLGFFVLALMSKPMAITLPVVLLILDWYPFRRIGSVKTGLFASTKSCRFSR